VQRIPLIDVAALAVRPDDPGTARALVDASHEVGFCYVAGHRVPEPVERAALAQARAFFDLGLESKLRLSIDNTPHFRGYTPLGHEYTRGAPDWREQIDLGLDEDPESVGPEDPPWRRLRGPNQWPGELPELRMAISAWTAAMQVLALDCLRSLAIGLGQPLDFFDTYMLPRGDPHLKLIRYDGAAGMSAGAERQGVGWHHDSGLLTFILQDAAAGLEVRTPGGVAAAPPRAGTYLMNLGEMLQRATNGFLRATEHRVVSPPPGSQRLSLAYFAHPKFEARFEPIPLPPELAAAAGGGENADPDDPVFHVFGDNYLKIRLRSHPDVAARFYRDAALR
jgi:isopenicillin N synthase-like dioxygenase